MSLYYVQKLIYNLNRDPKLAEQFKSEIDVVLSNYDLCEEELIAIKKPDIGLLYVLGVNGQLLMHFAALNNFEWDEYIQAMKDGITAYGQVRTGLYSRTGGGAI